jgi:hypothetical protein
MLQNLVDSRREKRGNDQHNKSLVDNENVVAPAFFWRGPMENERIGIFKDCCKPSWIPAGKTRE